MYTLDKEENKNNIILLKAVPKTCLFWKKWFETLCWRWNGFYPLLTLDSNIFLFLLNLWLFKSIILIHIANSNIINRRICFFKKGSWSFEVRKDKFLVQIVFSVHYSYCILDRLVQRSRSALSHVFTRIHCVAYIALRKIHFH